MSEFNELIPEVLDAFKKYTIIIRALEKEVSKAEASRDFYKQRCELLQQVQKYMRDPERTIVCDILANNSLLPDPEGKRYGLDLVKEIGETK